MLQCNEENNSREISLEIDNILKKKRVYLFFKRVFDIFASSIGLIIFAIPMIIISIFIKLTSKGPVFFRQIRVGKDNKDFKIFKFRTMVADADKKGNNITVSNDKRITGIGSFLRNTKLDEIPQLINVFLGQMSFVGPRPDVREYIDLYDDIQKNILKIKPGITSTASIKYRNEAEILGRSEDPEKMYIEEVMPEKIKLSLKYIEDMGFFYDLGLIFKTIFKIFDRE